MIVCLVLFEFSLVNFSNIPAVLVQVVTACDVFEDKPENKYSLKNIIDELNK